MAEVKLNLDLQTAVLGNPLIAPAHEIKSKNDFPSLKAEFLNSPLAQNLSAGELSEQLKFFDSPLLFSKLTDSQLALIKLGVPVTEARLTHYATHPEYAFLMVKEYERTVQKHTASGDRRDINKLLAINLNKIWKFIRFLPVETINKAKTNETSYSVIFGDGKLCYLEGELYTATKYSHLSIPSQITTFIAKTRKSLEADIMAQCSNETLIFKSYVHLSHHAERAAFQRSAIFSGFSASHVNSSWFSDEHLEAAYKCIHPLEIEGPFNKDKVEEILGIRGLRNIIAKPLGSLPERFAAAPRAKTYLDIKKEIETWNPQTHRLSLLNSAQFTLMILGFGLSEVRASVYRNPEYAFILLQAHKEAQVLAKDPIANPGLNLDKFIASHLENIWQNIRYKSVNQLQEIIHNKYKYAHVERTVAEFYAPLEHEIKEAQEHLQARINDVWKRECNQREIPSDEFSVYLRITNRQHEIQKRDYKMLYCSSTNLQGKGVLAGFDTNQIQHPKFTNEYCDIALSGFEPHEFFGLPSYQLPLIKAGVLRKELDSFYGFDKLLLVAPKELLTDLSREQAILVAEYHLPKEIVVTIDPEKLKHKPTLLFDLVREYRKIENAIKYSPDAIHKTMEILLKEIFDKCLIEFRLVFMKHHPVPCDAYMSSRLGVQFNLWNPEQLLAPVQFNREDPEPLIFRGPEAANLNRPVAGAAAAALDVNRDLGAHAGIDL